MRSIDVTLTKRDVGGYIFTSPIFMCYITN
uniref:Uncharacterized protein n=1 Tax=Heterorhabditis bacteriophora TaxID=37862 RepID=A0A1I7X5I3_HETBA